ncbi:MAG: ankyrin repeat domain-containing protein [Pedobacter sp.]|nr:MAG: ankyrin repeat domain-containing protein [Pedobacter sp.]
MKKSLIIAAIILLTFENVSMAATYKSLKNQKEVLILENSPLHLAISKGDIESVRRFIKYGADINKMSKDMTPLMVAALHNQVEIIKILLEKGVKPSYKNEKGYTALNYAEFANAKESITILKDLK